MVSAQVLKIVLLVVMVVMSMIDTGDAAYKRPPSNGSMFGKRSGLGECQTYFEKNSVTIMLPFL